MAYTITGSVQVGGVGQAGVTVSAWKASRFASPPAYNAAQPSGTADATATSGNAAGSPGGYSVDVPTSEPYYIQATVSGNTYWLLRTPVLFADGTSGDQGPPVTDAYVTNALTSATGLKTATGTVAVGTAAAPTSPFGQVLTATSATAATWQTPSGGSGGTATALATTGAAVGVSAAAPPSANYVLTATSATAAIWKLPTSATSNLYPINVTAYGALGNGSHDDTAAIKLAIAASLASNYLDQVVFFPPGVYMISSPLVIPSFCILLGGGSPFAPQAAISAMSTFTGPAMICNTAWYTGTCSSNQSTQVSGAVAGWPDCNFGIKGLGILGNSVGTAHGVAFYGTQDFVEDCIFQDNMGDNVRFTSTLYSGSIATTGGPNGHGVANGGMTTTHRAININTWQSGGHGISVIDLNNIMTDGMIQNCTTGQNGVLGSASPGMNSIHLDVAGGWDINHNHPTGSNGHMIYIGSSGFTRISNNYCDSWAYLSTGGPYYGIYVAGVNTNQSLTITDNTGVVSSGTNPGGICVASAGSPSYVKINGNNMQNEGTTSTGRSILVTGGGSTALYGEGTNWSDPGFAAASYSGVVTSGARFG